MTSRGHKLELDVPISEEALVAFLFSLYGTDSLGKMGIYPDVSVIRGMEIGKDRKCVFHICTVSLVDVESEEITPKAVSSVVSETAKELGTTDTTPKHACNAVQEEGCGKLKVLKIIRGERNSNKLERKVVSGGATTLEQSED